MIGSRWIDQGTAFCLGSFQNETQEAFIIARAESNFNEIILSTAIRGNDVYQRQQGMLFKACLVSRSFPSGSYILAYTCLISALDTLIVWTEPDGVDYALSFQDPEGCAEVWNFILDVASMLGNNTT